MAKDGFGYGTNIQGGEGSRDKAMEKYNEWLEPYLRRTREKYPDISENRIRFQTLSDILEESTQNAWTGSGTRELYNNLKKQGISEIFNSEYNNLLNNKGVQE
jgi:hypothetical protein